MAALCFAGNSQIPVADQFHLGVEELRDHLKEAPLLSTSSAPLEILLPTPNGKQLPFQVWESPILSPGLQTVYSGYRTYALQGAEQAYSGRLLVSPAGLNGVIIGNDQVLFIEPEEPSTDLHRIYYWKLGANYLSFDVPMETFGDRLPQVLRLAILADEEYARFHGEDMTRAVLASVNGLNAFLQLDQGIQLDLHYLGTVDRPQILACRTDGFRGRSGESLKLFGDLVAEGKLELADFDLGHLFSGRGFGSSTLAAVAGSDTYYDWNEDGIFDGPAKAAGGSGGVRPIGAGWWGNLCKGISRQIKSSDLSLIVQRSTKRDTVTVDGSLSTALENPDQLPMSMKYYAGLEQKEKFGFPYLSCLPLDSRSSLLTDYEPVSIRRKIASPDLQAGLAGGALWPWVITRMELVAVNDWLRYWRF